MKQLSLLDLCPNRLDEALSYGLLYFFPVVGVCPCRTRITTVADLSNCVDFVLLATIHTLPA